MLVNEDPPGHTRTRNLVNKAFVPQRISGLAPHIRAIAEQLVDGFASAGRADLIAELAYRLPMAVIGELLGLPEQDLDQIKRWTEDLVLLVAPNVTLEQQIGYARSSVAFQRYLEAQIEERRRNPRDDLLTDLVNAQSEGERPLSTPELISLLIVMIFAGHETTTNLIGNALLLLLRHPDAWRAVRADQGLLAAAVEEGLRMDAPVQGMFRTTTEAVEVGGVEIPTGARVFLLFASANRDAAVFPEPDRFDLHRVNKEPHLSFGRGIHFCIGSALARMEAQIAIDVIARRIPELRLDTAYPVTYLPSLLHRGPRQLYVTWDTPPRGAGETGDSRV